MKYKIIPKKFPFLIGRMLTSKGFQCWILVQTLFPFLIGRMLTEWLEKNANESERFPFLIGRMLTWIYKWKYCPICIGFHSL